MAAQAHFEKPFQAFNAPFKSKRNERRDPRVRYRASFSLLWDEDSWQPKYAKAASKDVSEHGMCLETSQWIPVGTHVSLRSETGGLFGRACVKHVARRGASHVIGVELGYSLLDQALTLVREIYSLPRAR